MNMDLGYAERSWKLLEGYSEKCDLDSQEPWPKEKTEKAPGKMIIIHHQLFLSQILAQSCLLHASDPSSILGI